MGWDKAINLALLDEYIDPDNSFLLTVSLACLKKTTSVDTK